MPDGLVKLIIIGAVGFFVGSAIMGWAYNSSLPAKLLSPPVIFRAARRKSA